MKYPISVIISIYNIEKYLSCCIESVLNQSYMPYEIILVDDGSYDNSLGICYDYKSKNQGLIKIINKKNGGLSSARNAGIKASKGMYCYFIDGDDYILPDTLKSFINVIEQYGEIDFIHGRMSYFEDGKKELREMPFYIDNSWDNYPISGKKAFCNAYRYQKNLQMGVRGLYRRDFIFDNNLFFVERDFSWPEDEEWTPRVFLCAEKCAGNDKPFYCYREARTGSETSKLLNIKTGLVSLETYHSWKQIIEEETDTLFSKTLLQEAGNRYLGCLIRYAKLVKYDDVKIFAKEAQKYKYLLLKSKPRGKRVILKPLFLLFGIYRFEILLYFLRKIIC